MCNGAGFQTVNQKSSNGQKSMNQQRRVVMTSLPPPVPIPVVQQPEAFKFIQRVSPSKFLVVKNKLTGAVV
jgi:hypothetical protein